MEKILNAIIDYLAKHRDEIINSSPYLSKAAALKDKVSHALLSLIFGNIIIVAILIVVIILCYLIFRPERILSESCYFINIEGDQVVNTRIKRDCDTGDVIALSVYQNAEGGIVLYSGQAAFGELSDKDTKNIWFEKYFNLNSINPVVADFGWELNGRANNVDLGEKDCKFGPNVKLYPHFGTFVRSREVRRLARDRQLTKEQREKCDSSNGDLSIDYCRWGYYEIFLPSISSRWCSRENIVDYWRHYFFGEIDISEKRQELCARGLELNGTPSKAMPWESWGVIHKVWCD